MILYNPNEALISVFHLCSNAFRVAGRVCVCAFVRMCVSERERVRIRTVSKFKSVLSFPLFSHLPACDADFNSSEVFAKPTSPPKPTRHQKSVS